MRLSPLLINVMPIQLHLPETRFTVVSITPEHYGEVVDCLRNVEGFVSLTRDNDEITLIIEEEIWERLAARFPEAQSYGRQRMIYFDTVLDFSVVGFIAEISRALAEAEISILSISTYSTDAVLVHESRFETAVAAVKRALVALNYIHLAQH